MTKKRRRSPRTRQSSRCWKTEVGLRSAGYFISKEVKDFSRESFAQKYKIEEGIIIIAPKRYSVESIIVHFIDEKKAISNKVIETMSTKMREHKIFDGIIMSNVPLSASAEKVGAP